MPCHYPQPAFKSKDGNVTFVQRSAEQHNLTLPCGQCLGCRIMKSAEWATRICHEASLHEDNVFITLTYNAENCPPDGGLIKKDFRDFMKRLRKHTHVPNPYDKKTERDKWDEFHVKNSIRFYHCGEYGDRNNRPHYHAIIFGYNFDDWLYLFDSDHGVPIYTSPTLEKLWGFGYVTVGEVSYESAAYVSRYVIKKLNGKLKDQVNEETGLKPYERYNDFTGEIHEVSPEYSTMSRGRRPDGGIGYRWITKYTSDVYPKNYTTIRGVKKAPPRYYDKYLESIDKDMYDDVKQGRSLLVSMSEDISEPRLRQIQKVQEAKTKTQKRNL
jgi:hypothetical protein